MSDHEALKNTFYIMSAILLHRYLPPWFCIFMGASYYAIAVIMAATA